VHVSINREKNQASEIISTLNKENIDKLQHLFRTCHALVVNRPLTDYNWLCTLDEMKGLTLGNTYRNIMSAKIFINAMAEIELQKVTSVLCKAQFATIIGDGSTDASVKEQEMWFLRTCQQGEINVKFFGVQSASKANAENIVLGVKSLVSGNLGMDWPEFASKLVGLSCDGASVMTGCRSGVKALLEKDSPCIVTIHCLAHRLELCLKDATQKIKIYDKAINVL
jgi:hypothetical protein